MQAVKGAVSHMKGPETLIHPLHISGCHEKQILVILIIQR